MKADPQFHVDLDLTIEGEVQSYQLPITWDCYRRIAQIGIDPAKVVAGQVELGSAQIVPVIHQALQAGGYKLTEEQVGEAIIRRGVIEYAEPVGLLMAGLVVGSVPAGRPKRSGGDAGPPGRASRGGTSSGTPTSSQ